jgi:hypothetical protein
MAWSELIGSGADDAVEPVAEWRTGTGEAYGHRGVWAPGGAYGHLP